MRGMPLTVLGSLSDTDNLWEERDLFNILISLIIIKTTVILNITALCKSESVHCYPRLQRDGRYFNSGVAGSIS